MILELKPKVQSAISQYTARHLDSLREDRLLPPDWLLLEEMPKV
jgi:hypothetical protein